MHLLWWKSTSTANISPRGNLIEFKLIGHDDTSPRIDHHLIETLDWAHPQSQTIDEPLP